MTFVFGSLGSRLFVLGLVVVLGFVWGGVFVGGGCWWGVVVLGLVGSRLLGKGLFGGELVFEDAEAVYFDLNGVAGLDRAYACGGAGRDEVAGFKRHEGSDV